jgi:hypothetical protein
MQFFPTLLHTRLALLMITTELALVHTFKHQPLALLLLTLVQF